MIDIKSCSIFSKKISTKFLLSMFIYFRKIIIINNIKCYLFIDFLVPSIFTIVLLLIGAIPQIYSVDHSPNSLFNKQFCQVRGYLSQSSAMACQWLIVVCLSFLIHMLIYADVQRLGFINFMMSTSGTAFYHTIYSTILGRISPLVIISITTKIL